MLKKQKIKRQQEELCYLEEQSKGTEHGTFALEEDFWSLPTCTAWRSLLEEAL